MKIIKMSNKRRSRAKEKELLSKINISIPGFSRIQDPNYGKKFKTIWLLSILLCALAAIYFTVDRVNYYTNYPISTKVDLIETSIAQFPTFSICRNNYLMLKLGNIVSEACMSMKNFVSCSSRNEAYALPLSQLNISLFDVWKKYRLRKNYISAYIEDMSDKNRDSPPSRYLSINETDTDIGSCITVEYTALDKLYTHLTSIIVHISLEWWDFLPDGYQLILNGERDIHEFELMYGVQQFVTDQYHNEFQIAIEEYHKLNASGRECYDGQFERQRVRNCVLDLFLARNICRLPFLPQLFRECKTANDVEESKEFFDMEVGKFLYSTNCSVRPICKKTIYKLITILKPLAQETTSIKIKFLTNTQIINSEYFSYTLPALMSDLFAYWGFFLCLSALVFMEILECIITAIFCLKNKLHVV